ncbi:hypothetical protein LOK49_LG03G01146 [Camellia lanceoleosa]|uniref:Uncharacterized protein n=1 Tax=Camellia lanceoleosa TaxID=1840588 RepID=A0ACC0IAP2_9ERIC|nr:hypothetical protein LOK49_LG03G01146 [Camellia lanceoleosa]
MVDTLGPLCFGVGITARITSMDSCDGLAAASSWGGGLPCDWRPVWWPRGGGRVIGGSGLSSSVCDGFGEVAVDYLAPGEICGDVSEFREVRGVSESEQRFARPIEFKECRGWVAPNSNIGSVVGSLGVLPDQQWAFEAQDDLCFFGPKEVGSGPSPSTSRPSLWTCSFQRPRLWFRPSGERSSPTQLGSIQPGPQSGLCIPTRWFGASSYPFCHGTVARIWATSGEDCCGGFRRLLTFDWVYCWGFSDASELGRVCVSPCDGLELHRTHTVMAVSPESGRPQAKAAVEDFGDCSYSLGSSVGVSPTFFPALVADEHCLQQLCCGEGCEIEEDAVDGSWSSRVDQLALVVHPVVVDAEVEVGDVVEDGINSPLVDFHEDVIPSSEEVTSMRLLLYFPPLRVPGGRVPRTAKR